MYVNEVTVDMGEAGEKAVRLMFDMAKKKGLVPDFELKISKPL
jgi:1,4-dihydroxy-6-naphthoate synthase